MGQRDQHDILKDILRIVCDVRPLYRNQMNQTRIGYEVGLTHPQTVKYLQILVNLRLLVMSNVKPFPYYEITKKGRRCLQLFSDMDDDLRAIVTG
jgi:predicted transcriptional regulator